jgi:hypothetical protein
MLHGFGGVFAEFLICATYETVFRDDATVSNEGHGKAFRIDYGGNDGFMVLMAAILGIISEKSSCHYVSAGSELMNDCQSSKDLVFCNPNPLLSLSTDVWQGGAGTSEFRQPNPLNKEKCPLSHL